MAETTQRCAVVTGANKGIGLEIAKQLASAGIKVVLTARDEKKGLEALERLRESGLSEVVVFHQLDVADAASVASLAHFIKSQFGRLDILVILSSDTPDSRIMEAENFQHLEKLQLLVCDMCRESAVFCSSTK